MRVVVCGSRDWTDGELIRKTLETAKWLHTGLIVAHGGARGADRLAGNACALLHIPVREYPARWREFGRAAGPIRNKEMLYDFRPDLVYAFTDTFETSKGTRHMAALAYRHGVQVTVVQHVIGGYTSSWDVSDVDIKGVEVQLVPDWRESITSEEEER